ncbi:MAG TPA: GNAT family N-acetyltransferase [Nocardioides sp.]|nr:GNAT family N-acetyltransferase [Nocardioides sp.]
MTTRTAPRRGAPTTDAVSLRPVTDDDRPFLIALYASTRAAELDQVVWAPGQREAFVRMQYDAQDVSYRTQNPEGAFDIIEVAGRPVGRLYVDRRVDEIRIVDIALVPEHRRAGIGSALIERLQADAAATGRTVTIHVEVHNPAAVLYGRLGFVAVAEHGLYRRMEWAP